MEQAPKRGQPLTTATLKAIALDFIVEEMPRGKVIEKYHLTEAMFALVVDHLDLNRKKEDYRRRLVDKALAKLAEKQSVAMSKAIKILLRQLDHIEKIQDYMASMPEDPTLDPILQLHNKLRKVLPSEIVNDVMKIFALVAKDNKLNPSNIDLGDNKVAKVIVEMANVPAFGRGAIDVTPQPPNPQGPEEAKAVETKEEVKVEAEGLGMPL